MSLGLLQFHLSSDLNLTSKTFLFSPRTHQPGVVQFAIARGGEGIALRFPASAYSTSVPFRSSSAFLSEKAFPDFIHRRVGVISFPA